MDPLVEMFDRIPELVRRAVEGLSVEDLTWRPAPGANPIGWLVWHLTRGEDAQVADVSGQEQVWVEDGLWAPAFGLTPDPADNGYGHTDEEVDQVRPTGVDVLLGYQDAVHQRVRAYVASLDPSELDRVVDTRWDPPVTLGVRLVSIADDAVQHAGQAAYVRGLRLAEHPSGLGR